MKCPKCGRDNPETERMCDCGYDLVAGGLGESTPTAHPGGLERPSGLTSGCIGLLLLPLPASMLPFAFVVAWGNSISIGGSMSAETKRQMVGPPFVLTILLMAALWLVAVVALKRQAKSADDPLVLLAILSGIVSACLLGYLLL